MCVPRVVNNIKSINFRVPPEKPDVYRCAAARRGRRWRRETRRKISNFDREKSRPDRKLLRLLNSRRSSLVLLPNRRGPTGHYPCSLPIVNGGKHTGEKNTRQYLRHNNLVAPGGFRSCGDPIKKQFVDTLRFHRTLGTRSAVAKSDVKFENFIKRKTRSDIIVKIQTIRYPRADRIHRPSVRHLICLIRPRGRCSRIVLVERNRLQNRMFGEGFSFFCFFFPLFLVGTYLNLKNSLSIQTKLLRLFIYFWRFGLPGAAFAFFFFLFARIPCR